MTTPPDTPKPPAVCEICGEPMPDGEQMFKFHGYSGPCPKPPLPKPKPSPQESHKLAEELERRSSVLALGTIVRDNRDAILAALRSSPSEQEARDAARYRWLRDLECNSVTVVRDDNAASYLSVKEWLEASPENYEDVPHEERSRMIAANTIWTVQVYPNTPVGFNWWHAATLDAAIDAAIAASGGAQGDGNG